MEIHEILNVLPIEIEWMVLFDVDVFRKIAGDDTFKEMYFINESTDLNKYNYVVLSSLGRYLSEIDTDELINGETLEKASFNFEKSLFEDYKDSLSTVNYNKAHCLAVANIGQFGKVVLFIEIEKDLAKAKAVFNHTPSKSHYELLQAIGVKYEGGELVENKFIARYTNKLPIHIHSGILNHFTRTDNCNIFFFNHGNIDRLLYEGLYTAYIKRKEWRLKNVEEYLITLGEKSLTTKLSMDWLPPTGNAVFPFGDVVPLGFLNLALQRLDDRTLSNKIIEKLNDKKIRGLWPFETNDLETSIDSALVLQSLNDKQAAKELNRFWNGIYGFLPQKASKTPVDGEMLYVDEKSHWCQSDIAITCLIYAIQSKFDLPKMIETENYIINSYEKRAGLYFANPYMVDWFYAQAIVKIKGTEKLQAQLVNDILSSLNQDYSVGKYDKVLSSAFAILALRILGYKESGITALQLYIVNNFDVEKGISIPYYSSLILKENEIFNGRKVEVGDKKIQISFHRDTHDAIYTSISFLALQETISSSLDEQDVQNYIEADSKEVYNNEDILSYIQNQALKPYV